MFSDAARGEVINLGNPEEHPVRAYAERIRALCGSRSPIVFVTAALGDDPHRRRPDIGKAMRLLGWRPRVSLDEGLQRTIAYFRAELERVGSVIQSG
jgi:nucleoside-diphosphate-sugar epimerase